ncbi:hypothetical protein RHSIM_Rhsim11G0009900 [Rhododendron simsii]|uniref:Zinc knuckle CX2CX4HX4C domain-containing protein n=1 Tax=Rhododendron simsii TaxID=118357 RepID=A0A834L934_RHOSS|nr:hypothetical protein RHSIM_Rhsim11G0009900 [Rhododendron simsii]
MGGLLVLARWNHDMTIEDLDFSQSPFWVQIHGLPLGQMNRKNGETIANLIGKLDSSGMKAYDTTIFKDYLRLRVIIDITKPLKKGFFLKRREKDDLWIRFKYERLSDFCYVCGLIGHGLNDCTKKFDGNHSSLKFGSFLRAEISIIETINPGKPTPTISNSSSKDFCAVDSPLVTAAREPTASVATDGTVSVQKGEAVVLCDKPAGKDLPGDATCLSSIPVTCSPRDEAGDIISSPDSGISSGNLKSIARRASIGRRRNLLNEVPITSSFQQNQQELLTFVAGFLCLPYPRVEVFKFESMLKALKKVLKNWSRTEFGNNKTRLAELKGQLAYIWSLAPTAENLVAQQAIHKSMETIMAREEMYLHQRSRVNWLNYGNRNSKFFHTTLIQRRQRNQILRLKAHDGVWKESDGDINLEIGHYFSSLFTTDGPRDISSTIEFITPKISGEMNRSLTKHVADEEIRVAVFQLGALKAPGPDGYPGLFFQKFWNEIREDTCLAGFFQGGFLLKKLNHTNIVLIPKVLHPESLSQFRPISLCNFSVKIISKVLANHLKKFLNGILSPYQLAFIPGRQIQDNILVAHEAFHFLKCASGYYGRQLATDNATYFDTKSARVVAKLREATAENEKCDDECPMPPMPIDVQDSSALVNEGDVGVATQGSVNFDVNIKWIEYWFSQLVA